MQEEIVSREAWIAARAPHSSSTSTGCWKPAVDPDLHHLRRSLNNSGPLDPRFIPAPPDAGEQPASDTEPLRRKSSVRPVWFRTQTATSEATETKSTRGVTRRRAQMCRLRQNDEAPQSPRMPPQRAVGIKRIALPVWTCSGLNSFSFRTRTTPAGNKRASRMVVTT